jgi:hypothetical protein
MVLLSNKKLCCLLLNGYFINDYLCCNRGAAGGPPFGTFGSPRIYARNQIKNLSPSSPLIRYTPSGPSAEICILIIGELGRNKANWSSQIGIRFL